MSNDLTTIVGTVVNSDPSIRFTPGGKAVCDFTVRVPGKRANTKYDRKATEAYFQRVTAWERLAENVSDSLRQGDRVIVVGLLQDDSYTPKDGETVERTKITAWNIGPDLSYITGELNRTENEPAEATAGAPF